jgi:hypothetical protein
VTLLGWQLLFDVIALYVYAVWWLGPQIRAEVTRAHKESREQ